MDSNPASTDEPEGAREAAGLGLFEPREPHGPRDPQGENGESGEGGEAMRNDRMPQYFQEHRTGDTLGTDVDRT
ncbi:hypothetical protein [Streptomyces sp. CB01881]|uniref:hypothetical protein n=1 Tax=Streptomyces sp. CB01881 TaxID=2078691 RepID=UPI000CDBE758|nr:hypothetical protein [Streptomyces sp. CB01881]AUY51483.1 hypothetical protein C2142_23970 [Streptomyces sp. CB01881]TYC74876.1 hypothetical protein EH183_23960 [Streptomyces sp. CB01881]